MKKYTNLRRFVLLALAISNLIFLFHVETVAQNQGFRGYQAVRYEGEALNTTYNEKAQVELKIQSIDRAGNVSASFGVKSSGSLIGAGNLTGTIDESGVLRLKGPFDRWQIEIAGRTNGETINANYHLSGYDKQDGRFTVKIKREENNAATPTTSAPNNFKLCSSGRYEGTITNTTYNQSGKAVFEIKDLDRNQNLTANFTVSGGLQGTGTLTGRLDNSGVLQLSGTLSGWDTKAAARINAQTLEANYNMLINGSGQSGNFNLKCVENSPSNPNRTPVYTNPPINPNDTRVLEPERRVSNGESINGAWKGTYTCPQGLTNLVLSLFAKDGTNVDGIFTFLLGDGAEMSVLGSFKMKGTYDSRSGRVELKGTDWDQKPAGFFLVDLSGRVTQPGRNMSGNVTGLAGCTTFQVEKIKFK
jgi:hypothetical protein